MARWTKAADLWIPSHLKPANKPVSIVFWHSQKLNRIVVGLPEQYPVPSVLRHMGFNKVVCRTAHDVEIWSQKMRDQDRRDEEMTDAEREAFEAPLRQQIRADLQWKMMNSRNAINKEFCRQALIKMDEDEQKHKVTRESFMHVEAHESGK
jgi:hypothetical protein